MIGGNPRCPLTPTEGPEYLVHQTFDFLGEDLPSEWEPKFNEMIAKSSHDYSEDGEDLRKSTLIPRDCLVLVVLPGDESESGLLRQDTNLTRGRTLGKFPMLGFPPPPKGVYSRYLNSLADMPAISRFDHCSSGLE